MFSFRQKITFCYLFVFLIFLFVMSSVSSTIIRNVVENAMKNRSRELISKIETASNNEMMIRRLKELKPLIFFRVSVISNDRKVLYDSHKKRLLGPRFSQEHVVNHPEVLEAFSKGSGYAEDYSDLLAQKFAYTAVAFDFHGKTYVMRTAFPYHYVHELVSDFEIGFSLMTTIVLVLFSIMTWFIMNHFTKPVQELISIVSSYKENERNPLPEMKALVSRIGSEDVGKLATTLVLLSERLQNQISTLKEERNEKEILLESLVEGVIATNPQLIITFVNQAALNFLGMKKEELLGASFKAIAQEATYQLLLSCQEQAKPIVDTLKLDFPEQTLFLDVVAVPKQDNTGAILVMIDKSDHYKILEMRKDFIANASHELKTPITIIRGFAETLFDNPHLEEGITRDITSKIVRNCERMATLVRDLLALADIENIPSSRIQTVDLIDLLNKVIQEVRSISLSASIQIESPEGVTMTLQGDYDLLEMAFMNLVTNAVKYSNSPPKVTLKVSKTEDTIEVSVIDQGIGIPKEDQARIFERFYRVDKARSRKVGGSGLGLSIVDTVIKKHFGKISVESEVGLGTTFKITLPRGKLMS
jgi:two-component system phosphate regulon sensor histidine kinase PhoR